MRLRISAIIPFVASAAAFALAIVLLAAGTSTSTANDKFWLAPASTTSGSSPSSLLPNPLPGRPNPLQPLSDLLTGFINSTNLSGTINSGIQDLQSTVLSELIDGLNLAAQYRLYLTQACSVANRTNVVECTSYRDRSSSLLNATNAIPDALPLGPLGQARIPLVTVLKSALSKISELAVGGAAAMFALLIIGCVSEGLGMILAVLAVLMLPPIRPGQDRGSEKVLPVTGDDGVVTAGVGRGDEYDAVGISGRKRLILRVILFLSLLGASALVLSAVVTTALVIVADVAQSLGDAVGLQIVRGEPFLGIVWASAGLAVLACAYWVAVWFVEYRRTAFVRTVRTEMQVGNWKGISREVLNNLKVKRE